MKFTPRLLLALLVALSSGLALSPAYAQQLDENYDYPVQHQIESRTIRSTHHMSIASTPMSVVDEVVYFNSASSELTGAGAKQVAKMASIIKAPSFHHCHLTVKGYTDNKGGEEKNMKLSLKRAERVMHVLVSKYGIAADSISAEGLGEENPVADNKTAAGRALNRRAIIVNGCMW